MIDIDTAPEGKKTTADFTARLVRCAKTLPKGFVKKSIGKMRQKIIDVVKAKGYHAKSD